MVEGIEAGPRKLVMIIPTMNRKGGAQRVFFNLLSGINKDKFSITLIVNTYDANRDYAIPAGINLLSMNLRRSRFAIFRIILQIRKIEPDLVLSTMGYMNLLLLIFKVLMPRRTRVLVRESNTVSEKIKGLPCPWLYKYLYKTYYKKSDGIIAQSHFMGHDLEKNFGVDPDLIRVFYNPVDVASLGYGAEVLPRAGLRGAENAFICIGRLTFQKGYDLLIQSLRHVTTRFKLDIYGDGPDRLYLQSLINDYELGDRVVLRGFTKFPHDRMREADALLLPSRFEGLPNVVLEAHCLGLPVIAFNGPGGTGEIIKSGVNGYLVAPYDCDGLANAISTFSRESFVTERIALEARQKFHIDRIAAQYERHFLELLY